MRAGDRSSHEAWPILVVSLADAAERRLAMRAQLEALGLPFSFLDAVDGRRGRGPRFEAVVDRPGTLANLRHPLSDVEYACALSHQLAYAAIVDNGWPGAIILEDDALLTDRFRSFCETRGYEAAPLIQLFYSDAIVWKTGQRSTPAARLHRLAARAWGTVAYSISAEAAATMRAHSLPLKSQADWPCDSARIIGHYVTEPRLALHADPAATESAIHDAREQLFPADYDFTAGFAKGWRRLASPASWRRLLARGLTERRRPGFVPTAEEQADLVRIAAPKPGRAEQTQCLQESAA